MFEARCPEDPDINSMVSPPWYTQSTRYTPRFMPELGVWDGGCFHSILSMVHNHLSCKYTAYPGFLSYTTNVWIPSMQHMPSIVEFQILLKGICLIIHIGTPLIRADNTTLKLLHLAKTALFSWKKYLTLLLMLQDFVSFLLVTTALVTSPEAQALSIL